MSRIDTLTSKEQITEDVPQEILIIGALRLANESVDTSAESAGKTVETEKPFDWNQHAHEMFLNQEDVISTEYLLAGEVGLTISVVVPVPGNETASVFSITATEDQRIPLIKVYYWNSIVAEYGWTKYLAEKLLEEVQGALRMLKTNPHPRVINFRA